MTHSLASLTQMAVSASGIGTLSAMQETTSPKGVLQHIINFFTFGGVRRDNEKQYHAFVQSLAHALRDAGCDRGNELPDKITVDDFKGNKVEFCLPGINHPSGPAIVNVSKGNNFESENISTDIFKKVCNTLLFRNEFSIPQHPIVLTENEGMYLKGAVLSGVDLTLENLAYADLSDSKLDESTLINTDLSYAKLTHSDLSAALLIDNNLSGADMEGIRIYGGKIKHCKLINTNLKYAKVMASSVKDCDFTGANMESTRLSATKFLDVDLKHCNFNGADIFASEFSHTDLTNANFERVKLALSTLDGGEITQAELFEDF
ncbi:pentapeptide repeat-containing protein [Lonsdalea quercina]|uniref:pentapeptide repeat-containing protein n=1 Tax=Lonsdalea quercina TaxID=71657 RepID=UPI003976B86D